MEKRIQAPISREVIKELQAGDYVYITGTIYTARDAAHKRMQETLDAGKELPMEIQGTVLFAIRQNLFASIDLRCHIL